MEWLNVIVPALFTLVNIVLFYKIQKEKAQVDILKTKAETKKEEIETEKTTLENLAATVGLIQSNNLILRERLQTTETDLLELKRDFRLVTTGVKCLIRQLGRLDSNVVPDFIMPDFRW